MTAKVLVVGGGGGGNNRGGGGGGGLVYTTEYLISSNQAINVVVGAGGGCNGGAAASNSVFGTLTGYAGGNGGTVPSAGSNGGSGGGASCDRNGNPRYGGSGVSGQGYAGGNCYNDNSGGGGGGAAGIGKNGNATAYGGPGLDIDITGTYVGYAGGGGGAIYSGAPVCYATHGGGNGYWYGGYSATANTGGGGGGCGHQRTAGNGGSGIVIVRYSKGMARAIAGRIVDSRTGIGMDGVLLTLSGGAGQIVTSGGGYYRKPVDAGWSGTVVPTHGRGGTFAPADREYADVIAYVGDQDFVWTSPGPLVAGRVVDAESGVGLDGVTVSAGDGNSAVTANGGYYELTVATHWTGSVTPAHTHGQFEPASQSYDNVVLDQLNRDFTWSAASSISGQVTNEFLGAGMDGVTIHFADAEVGAAADTNTILLLHANSGGGERAIRDSSLLRRAMTVAGTPRILGIQKKFGNGSLYLNGSSYIGAPPSKDLDLSTEDFTVDLWVRLVANQAYNPLVGVGDGNASGRTTGWLLGIVSNQLAMYRYDGTNETQRAVDWTPTINEWHHLAAVRAGDVLRFYVDGAQIGADQDAAGLDFSRVEDEGFHVGGNIWMGAGSQYNLSGYLDEVRISKRTARWTGAFPPPSAAYLNDGANALLLHGDSDGDASASGRMVNLFGDAQSGSAISKYGGAALKLDGTGDYVEVESSVDFDFGAGNFTVDWWHYSTSNMTGAAFVRDDRSPTPFLLGYNSGGTLNAYMSGNGTSWDIASAKSMGAATLNTWVHFAVVRSGTTFYTFRNGIQVSTWSSALALAAGNAAPKIGVYNGVNYMAGSLDEFRVTKGRALWTTNFTPPSVEIHSPYPGAGDVVTANGGQYSQAVSVNWSGTATPMKGADTFSPAARTHAASAEARTNQDFLLHPANAMILGRVRETLTGGGVDGVLVRTSDGSNALTSADGSYRVEVPWSWTGTVSVAHSMGTFTSTSRAYENVTAYQADQDYEWQAPAFALSGLSSNDAPTVGGGAVILAGSGFYGSGSRHPVAISYAGATLTNAGVLVRMDTASLIAAGRMRSDGGDLRWFDADGETALAYWLESGLDTADTLAWVSVPLLASGGKTIYYSCGDGARAGESSLAGVFPALANAARVGLWLKGNAGTGAAAELDPVSAWQDQSGNGRHALQGAPAKMPSFVPGALNGLPAVSFDGNADFLGFERLTSIRDSFFAIGVDATQASGCNPSILGDSAGTYHFHGASGGQGSTLIDGSSSALLRGGAAYVNGASVSPTSIAKQPAFQLISFHPTGGLTADQIARNLQEEGCALGADWAETILFVDALTTAERLQVQSYLNQKYRLFGTNALPSAQAAPVPTFEISVRFGDAWAEAQVVDSETILVYPPTHAAGTVDVVVSNRNGQVETLAGAFTFIEYPDPIVSGRVTNYYTGAGVDGAALYFSGGQEAFTAGGGYYSQAVAYATSVSVVATNPGAAGAMVPTGRSYAKLRANEADQDYAWQPRLHVLSGRIVHHYTGAGVDGVTVVFSDGGGSAMTAGGGYFSHTLPYEWTGCVAPTSSLGVFSPENSCHYTNIVADISGVQFAWVPPARTISGRVTAQEGGGGLDGVTVQFSNSGGSALTADGGHYSQIVYHGWSGSATPATNRGSFGPPSRSYSSLSSNVADQDFTWIAPVEISGRIAHYETETGADGVTVTFNNNGGSTYTAGGGYYTQEVVFGWSGRATPSLSGKEFTPAYRDYGSATNAQPDQDYTWAPAYIPGTRYVSLSGINQHPYTNWYTAARDLQTAIDATRSGGSISVADGTYDLLAPVACRTSMVIRSANGAEWTQLRQGSGTSAVISLRGSGVVLDGFAVENGSIVGDAAGLGAGATVADGAEIRNSIIRRNTNQVDGGAAGLAMTNQGRAVNCLIYGNDGGSGQGNAGGVMIESGSSLINCTIYGNAKSGGTGAGGVHQASAGNAWIDNSIVWGNAFGSNVVALGTLYLRRSCYESASGTQTPLSCLQSDPLLVDPASGDFHLSSTSPCVNAGSNAYNALTTDLEGAVRFSQAIDMGAYEFFHTMAPVIRGRVVHQYTGYGMAGETVTFSGGAGSVLTDELGFYSNGVANGWTGQVEVVHSLGEMTPSNRAYAGLITDQNNQNFTWNPPLYEIAGRIAHHSTGAGVDGVVIQFSNGGGSVTTAGGGQYAHTVYHGWSGAATVSYSSGWFSPAQRSYESMAGDVAGDDYVWTPPYRNVSGRIIDPETGLGVAGVAMMFSNGGGSTETLSDGTYTQPVEEGWQGLVTPSFNSGSFAPANRTYGAVSSNMPDQGYEWIRPRRISGQVTNQITGAGMEGVAIVHSDNGIKTNLTDAGGWYTAQVTRAWSGYLYPVAEEGTFTPDVRSYVELTNDLSEQHFSWLPPVQITGRITREDDGTGLDGVRVSIYDNGWRSVYSVGGGYYSCPVPSGWSGAATVSYPSGSFTPASRSYEVVTSPRTDQDYEWILPIPVSGRVTNSDTGAGLAGAVIGFSDGGGSVTTSAGGYYTQMVVRGWSGDISASLGGGTLSPSIRTLTGVTVPVTGQDFIWYPDRTLSGRVLTALGHGLGNMVITLSNGGGEARVTDGQWTKAVPHGWSGRAVPVRSGGSFLPPYLDFTDVASNRTGQDFAWEALVGPPERYVSPSGNGTPPYTNWAMAATTIQAALEESQPGDLIWVTNGVYAQTNRLTVNKAVTLKSVNGASVTRVLGGAEFGVLRLDDANAVVSGFTIEQGQASDGSGAGVALQNGYLRDCILTGNDAEAVVMAELPSARMANCLIFGNAAAVSGGGVIINCTIYGNDQPAVEAALVYNSISEGTISSPEIRFTMAPTLYSGEGNQTNDPQFVDAEAGNYRPSAASSARDAGNDLYNTLIADLAGDPRIFKQIDLGAYETAPDSGLSVALSSQPNPTPAGGAVRFDVTVVNAGPGAASGVVVTCLLAHVSYQSNSVGAAYGEQTGAWPVGALAPGEAQTLRLWAEATEVGFQTNAAQVAAESSDGILPGYGEAWNVTRVLGAVGITNVVVSGEDARVEWNSESGVGYDIYSFAGELRGVPPWTLTASVVATNGSIRHLDAGAVPANCERRYYQVAYAGQSPQETNMWGVIRCSASAASHTLISSPLRTDRRFDGEFGEALAEVLTGADGGGAAGADEVHLLQPNGAWRTLYLNAAGTWRESNGEASAYELSPGQGFWVARKAGTAARFTFTGPVGNDGTRTNRLAAGWNLIGLSEGKDLSLAQTLATAHPVGAASEKQADQIVIRNPNGTWRRLMFVDGWGAPYAGNWFDLGALQIVSSNEVLEPGAAYYYLRRGEAADVRF